MKIGFVLVLLVVVNAIGANAQNVHCAALVKSKDPETLRGFLQQQERLRQSPCLPRVISRVGELHDTKAAEILIDYLDYMDPSTAPLPNGGAFVRPNYPAISALFVIGKPATVQLLSAISIGGKSPEFEKNAIRTYADIYRDDLASGIRALKEAELTTESNEGRSRLHDARQELLDECSAGDPSESEACKDADRG